MFYTPPPVLPASSVVLEQKATLPGVRTGFSTKLKLVLQDQVLGTVRVRNSRRFRLNGTLAFYGLKPGAKNGKRFAIRKFSFKTKTKTVAIIGDPCRNLHGSVPRDVFMTAAFYYNGKRYISKSRLYRVTCF